jgi:hypothetical protein
MARSPCGWSIRNACAPAVATLIGWWWWWWWSVYEHIADATRIFYKSNNRLGRLFGFSAADYSASGPSLVIIRYRIANRKYGDVTLLNLNTFGIMEYQSYRSYYRKSKLRVVPGAVKYLVWCPRLNKRIAPLSYFHGCCKGDSRINSIHTWNKLRS